MSLQPLSQEFVHDFKLFIGVGPGVAKLRRSVRERRLDMPSLRAVLRKSGFEEHEMDRAVRCWHMLHAEPEPKDQQESKELLIDAAQTIKDLAHIADDLHADRATLWCLSPDRQWLRQKASFVLPGVLPPPPQLSISEWHQMLFRHGTLAYPRYSLIPLPIADAMQRAAPGFPIQAAACVLAADGDVVSVSTQARQQIWALDRLQAIRLSKK